MSTAGRRGSWLDAEAKWSRTFHGGRCAGARKRLIQRELRVFSVFNEEAKGATPVMAASFLINLIIKSMQKRGRKHFSLIAPVWGASQSKGTIIGAGFFLFFFLFHVVKMLSEQKYKEVVLCHQINISEKVQLVASKQRMIMNKWTFMLGKLNL